jgi:deoxyribodipyrimidine photo-lyase
VEISLFWFRRDLRLEDNTALNEALNDEYPVLPIFIFDPHILNELSRDDHRVQFIYSNLLHLHTWLTSYGSGLSVHTGTPAEVFQRLALTYSIRKVYLNWDYEPYALQRDNEVKAILGNMGIEFVPYKDQVIFEKDEILKADGKPYTVYTPYKNKWLEKFRDAGLPGQSKNLDQTRFFRTQTDFPTLSAIGFLPNTIKVTPFRLNALDNYEKTRDYPALDATSHLSPHLRFGTVSVRDIIREAGSRNPIFLSELIWREFFMQILYHFPQVVNQSFKPAYDRIPWRNDPAAYERWCSGETGYPIVDAGMRELNQTGYMHNRVRMITASFLCKHLLIDWRWGEAYFAKKLLDYELSSNNGNWQWAAGTGCDAAPYFRVFNPTTQQEKFDKDFIYIKKWVPEYDTSDYPEPLVDHKMARERAISTYKKALS